MTSGEYKIRFGYASTNISLGEEKILTQRTTRLSTIATLNEQSHKGGIKLLMNLFDKNLDDLLLILKWNLEHEILFYRIGSNIAPHITNPLLMSENKRQNPEKLLYSLEPFAQKLKKIGDFAIKHKMRLTMHPDPFYSIGALDKNMLREARRNLYFHALFMEKMGLDKNSVIILHGGGIYGNKFTTMQRWVKKFNKLSQNIKERISIENDEKIFSIFDIMILSKSVEKFEGSAKIYKIPIVFDIFHYFLYNQTLLKKRAGGELILKQPELDEIIPFIINSWNERIPKMHISEYRENSRFGAHGDYVSKIPKQILNITKICDLDIMVEAKMKELAALKLIKKYKKYI